MPKTNNTKNNVHSGRRQLTKQILVGGGVIGSLSASDGKWIKPVLKEATLPAHADTTNPPPMPMWEFM